MNPDAFKDIEQLFHELLGLDPQQRAARLEQLRTDDPQRAKTLASLLEHASDQSSFLDTDLVSSRLPDIIDIPLDGSITLAGRYTIVGHIAAGGSSTILRATMKSPERDVAIKVLRIGVRSPSARERFTRESQALAELSHPHVAHVYETGIHTHAGVGIPWIAMELIRDARTLHDYARDPNVSRETKREIYLKILDAIRSAHDQGILHLDINSANVLIDRYGHPRVIDFGLSGLPNDPASSSFRHAGTRVSMAPEQTVYSRPDFSQRTDIYALALLYVELMHGVQLQRFNDLSDEESRSRIRTGKARELLHEINELDERERGTLDRMLRVDPDDRPPDVQSVIDALAQPAPEQARKPRTSTYIAAFALLIVVTMVLFRLALSSPSDGDAPDGNPQRGDALSIPAGIAMELSLQDPRTTTLEPNLELAIQSIASALRNEDTLSAGESARLHSALADRFRAAGRNEESLEHYRAAIDAYGQADDPYARSSVQLRLADLLLFLGFISEAELELEQIDRERIASPVLLLDLSIAEAQIAMAREHDDAALAQLRYALDLADRLDQTSRPLQIERLVSIAQLARQLGDDQLMLQGFDHARAVAESLSPSSPERVALVDLARANVLFQLDDPTTHAEAIAQAEEATARLAMGQDRFHHAWGLRQTGHMHMSAGDANAALALYAQAHEILLSTLGDEHHETIVCDGYLGIAASVLHGGSSPDGQRYFTALRALREQLGPEHDVVTNLEGAMSRANSIYDD
ncbi:MAG: serine/threonine protein kinase [Phycisphaerales bacterium]|nr:serine/threonine protein kinase [Phycisphaerales bacterium]